MSLPVYWTPTARDDYNHLLKILEEEKTLQSVQEFLDNTEATIAKIKENPRSFPNFDHNDRFRIADINDQTSIIFQAARVNSRVLYFWDKRKKDG